MPFYEWSKAMSVGVSLIDSDHKALIVLINQLHENLESGDAPNDMDDVFIRLVAYVKYHFAREEELMEACGFPYTETHREEHIRFARVIRDFRQRNDRLGRTAIGEELLVFLKDWLTHHILIQDMAYRTHAEGNPRATEAAQRSGPGLSDPEWGEGS